MVVDSTLAFAARRNVPVPYNRDLVARTLKAMERVAAVRARRERVFHRARMSGNRARARSLDRKLVLENGHLLRGVVGRAVEDEETVEVGRVEDVVEEVKVRERRVKKRLLVGGGVESEMDAD